MDVFEPPLALIMAGGSGTRFWPLSRKECPKQFHKLFGEKSLLRQTVDRVLPIVPAERVYICSLLKHRSLIEKEGFDLQRMIFEPEGKNTAPCLILSTLELIRRGVSEDTPVIVLPSDHYIDSDESFRHLLKTACAFAIDSGGIVTLGIQSTEPHTGYGYIEADSSHPTDVPNIHKVKRFIEKPSKPTATQLIQTGNCYWNSGIFVWTLKTIRNAFKRHLPKEWNALKTVTSV